MRMNKVFKYTFYCFWSMNETKALTLYITIFFMCNKKFLKIIYENKFRNFLFLGLAKRILNTLSLDNL